MVIWVFFWHQTGIPQLIYCISLFGTVLGALCGAHTTPPTLSSSFPEFLITRGSCSWSFLSCLIYPSFAMDTFSLQKRLLALCGQGFCLLVFCVFTVLWVMSAWWPLATIPHASTSYSCSEQCFLKSGDLTYVLFASFCARGYRGGVNQAKQSPQTLGPLMLLSGLLCHSQIPGSFLGISPVAHFLKPWGLGWIWDFLGPSCLIEKSWKPERCQDPK